MALIRSRHVPLAFIVRQVNKRPKPEDTLEIVEALQALHVGGLEEMGISNLSIHFVEIDGLLCVTGGVLPARRAFIAVKQVDRELAKSALSSRHRAAVQTFATQEYGNLKHFYDSFERVMRESERTTTVPDALKRCGVSASDWLRIKGWMNRFGLFRDLVHGRNMILYGGIARELQQRNLGERLEDVVHRILRDSLGQGANLKRR